MPEDDQRFAECLAETLRHEGGYADNPKDPGGATKFGVTRRTLAAWRGVSPWTALSKDEVKALGRDEAGRIYRKLYWERCRCGDLPAGLDLVVFDYAVNSGPDRAVKDLQRALRVVADGIVGPLTLSAVAARIAGGAGPLIAALCDARLGFLGRLATFATFGRGWTRRVTDVRRAALTMAGADPAASSPGFDPRRQTMDVLSGYRTYIIGGLMLLAAAAQLIGIDLPALDGQSAGQMLMEALAIIFLRRGIKGEIGRA